MRNVMAHSLSKPQYRKRVVKSKVVYNRKKIKLTSRIPTANLKFHFSEKPMVFC